MSLLMTVLITVRVPNNSYWLQSTLLNNLKIALWCFSSTVADYLLLVHHLWITELFKNTRTLKFKSQLTFGFFAPVNHLNEPLRKQNFTQTGSKGHVLWSVIGGFRSVLCVSVLQGSLLVIVIMVDGSEKRNREDSFWISHMSSIHKRIRFVNLMVHWYQWYQ